MWGMADILIPPTVGETMHREIPYSVFEGIVGCGHLAPSQCPRPVLEGTIQFLKAALPCRVANRCFRETRARGGPL